MQRAQQDSSVDVPDAGFEDEENTRGMVRLFLDVAEAYDHLLSTGQPEVWCHSSLIQYFFVLVDTLIRSSVAFLADRYIGVVTRKNNYCIVKIPILGKSIPKIFCYIMKTKALVRSPQKSFICTKKLCNWDGSIQNII